MVTPASFFCLVWADRRVAIASCRNVFGCKGNERTPAHPWQDRYTLMGHYTLHILLKPSSKLSKHIRAYIINSNFYWTLFVHSQPRAAEVKSCLNGKHCHCTPSSCRQRQVLTERHREAQGWRRLNTNCFQGRRCGLSVRERTWMCEQGFCTMQMLIF